MPRFYVVHASGAVNTAQAGELWPMNFVVTVADQDGNAVDDPKFQVWSGQDQGLIDVISIKQPAPAKWFALQHFVNFTDRTPAPQEYLYVIRAFNRLENGGVVEGQTTVAVTWLGVAHRPAHT